MNDLFEVLKTLNTAYPKRESLSDEGIRIYINLLSDIPVQILQIAADNIIKNNKWFPSVAELRAEAKRVANLPSARDFRSVNSESANQLLAEVESLYTAFFEDRTLDEGAWNALADKFERMERLHRAEHTRETLVIMKGILETEGQPLC